MSLSNIGSPAAGAPAPTQSFQNFTLDDASPDLTYQGFTQTQEEGAALFDTANLYAKSVSYTTAAQATASFQFKGKSGSDDADAGIALYVYGICGPEMGAFTITVDSKPPIALSAAATTQHYNQLLFAQSQLDDQQTHTVIITNQENGKILALDYFVLTSDGSRPPQSIPQPTAPPLPGEPGPDSTGAIIGGIIGGLVALVSPRIASLTAASSHHLVQVPPLSSRWR